MNDLKNSLQQSIGNSVQIVEEPLWPNDVRFRVLSPFRFSDGDHCSIVIKEIDGQWFFTDEGNTFMHLSIHQPIEELLDTANHKIIDSAKESFNVFEEAGELRALFNEENMGEVFFAYAQALCIIGNICCP